MKIQATGFITLSRDVKTVFDFIANLENDRLWRKEIRSTTMTTKPQLQAIATEDSVLSKRVPSFVLKLVCVDFSENQQVVYKTPADSAFFLESRRRVEAVGENQTVFHYEVTFDANIAKHGLGFGLPAFLVGFVAKTDMKKYLKKLKAVLEAGDR